MAQQIAFLLVFVVANVFAIRSAKRIWDDIHLGQPIDRTDQPAERFKRMLLIAFGQKKMFKRPIPALLHLFVYLGFFIVNIELLEIVLDGLFGTHRMFQDSLGGLYPALINFFEFFAVAVLVSCVIFLIRRNVVKVPRFEKPEMTSWPKLDANLILVFEIALMFFLLSMNATDTLLHNSEGFFFSNMLTPLYAGMSPEALHIAERVFWWSHIIGVFFFANYVFYSKHLHIFLAFPNTYFSNLNPMGKMVNMDAVTNEVKLAMGMQGDSNMVPPERFGAKDITDLTRKQLLDAYACTECGRCTDNCPANMTGKKLSPRKIMMDTRDRMEDLGKAKRENGKDHHDGKFLMGDYISEEEINACTTCNACVEACPVNIDPLSIILDLRRYKIMEESKAPAEWNMMFQNIETSFSPWKFPPSDRGKWMNDMNS